MLPTTVGSSPHLEIEDKIHETVEEFKRVKENVQSIWPDQTKRQGYIFFGVKDLNRMVFRVSERLQ